MSKTTRCQRQGRAVGFLVASLPAALGVTRSAATSSDRHAAVVSHRVHGVPAVHCRYFGSHVPLYGYCIHGQNVPGAGDTQSTDPDACWCLDMEFSARTAICRQAHARTSTSSSDSCWLRTPERSARSIVKLTPITRRFAHWRLFVTDRHIPKTVGGI
jgi:hypothetical protein